MPADLPPNLANKAASAIVREAENQKRAESIIKKQRDEDRRRREQAMRDAGAQRRTPGTSGK